MNLSFAAPLTLSLALAAGLAPASSAQTVHVVDAAGGPGSNFTTIGAAVAAASDGDFVLVRAGFYAETVRLDGMGLVLQAAAGASVTIEGIEVENLAAGQVAALRGFERWYIDGHISLRSNLGSVWIEDLSPPPALFPIFYLDAIDCASVVLRRCDFEACCIGRYAAVQITRSNVAFYEGAVRGEDRGSDPFGTPGGAGVSALDSRVTLYGSAIEGGKGADGVFGTFPGPGGAALVASGATVVEVIGTTLTGGPGGKTGLTMGATGPKSLTFGGATVLVRPNRAHLLTTSSPVTSGATPVALVGDPGDLVFALIGSSPGPFTTAGNWFGPLVTPMQAPLMFLGVLPGSGTLSTSVAPLLPPGTLVESFYLQGIFLGGGEIALGTPTQVHVLDPSL